MFERLKEDVVSVYAHNTQGINNGMYKANKEKMISERMENHDVAIYLETGVNNNQKRYPNGNDKFEVAIGNRMAPITNERRQHVGSGSAIMVRRGTPTQHIS